MDFFGFLRGLTKQNLRQKISPRNIEYRRESGKILTNPGEMMVLLDRTGDEIVEFLGFIDLRELGAGDAIDIELKMSLDGEKPGLNNFRRYENRQVRPIVDFPMRHAINPVITIKQVAGVPRTIGYRWGWAKLS